MADIQNQQKYGDLYNHLYPYQKNFYNIATIPSTHTYRGTVEIPAGLTQKGTGTYPLVHAKDVQIGNIESDRLNDKLADYDIILRELYGRAPSQLEQLSDGRSSQEINNLNTEEGRSIANDNLRVANNDGLESLDKIATVLNNRTETIDDRLLDLRAFKTVNINGPVNNTNDLTNGNSQTEIKADNNADSISIKSENEWIILTPDASSDSFTIGHYKKGFSKTTGTAIDLNSDNTNTITLQTVEYDAAGHITADTNTTYTLPQNFKTVSVSNANVNSINGITIDNNSIVANNSFADMKFIAGNKWIQFATDNTKREITIAHALSALEAGAHNSAYTLDAQTPNFGSNFNIFIPTISFTTDTAGHVTAYSYSSSNATVTLPIPNITSSSTGQVVTSIDKDITEGHNNGTFTYSKANIGTFAITGYTLGSNSVLEATDNLNVALGKLQAQINSINSWRINGAAITNSTLLNAATLKMSDETNAATIQSAIAAASTAHTTAGYLTDFSTLTAQDIINKLTADGVNLWSLKQALDAATDPNANPGEG